MKKALATRGIHAAASEVGMGEATCGLILEMKACSRVILNP